MKNLEKAKLLGGFQAIAFAFLPSHFETKMADNLPKMAWVDYKILKKKIFSFEIKGLQTFRK
ncbi:MAG: hypothetical protein QXP46_07080 [Archaeoglobaceae archaeon]